MLERRCKETKAEFDDLNSRSFEYQTLKREAEGDKKLYEELVRKIKEAGINASFQNSSIRIADAARPGLKPVFPQHLAERAAGVSVRDVLRRGRGRAERRAGQHHSRSRPGGAADEHGRDRVAAGGEGLAAAAEPDPVHQRLSGFAQTRNGTPTATGTAHGAWKGACGRASWRCSAGATDQALSNYEEAIRTLRNSILLTDFDRRLRSVLLTSASPSEGKSTVAAHLAATHASQHKRTLLIDGDLRRPSVHRLYQVPNSVGLSNVLLQQISWRDAVIRMDDPQGLDILPAGPSTRRASDLMGMGLAELIEEATREYDLVVLDAPPLLGFAEPLQMATAVDGVIVVARAGDTSRKALSIGDHDAGAAAGEFGGRGVERGPPGSERRVLLLLRALQQILQAAAGVGN